HSDRSASPMSPSPYYIELHARSAFSFLRGASTPAQMVAAAAHCGLPALAICDRDGVYGSPRLHEAAHAAGIRPIIGAELTLADNAGILPVLVATANGYRNLCQLLSYSQQQSPKGICTTSWETLAIYADG